MQQHLARIRELESELADAKRALHEARCNLGEMEKHFAVAVAAVADAAKVGKDGRIAIVDGWNILNTTPVKTKSALVSCVRREILSAGNAFVWIVFDGPEEKSASDGSLRITYTGGRGGQRADRLILDYIHALKFAGVRPKVELLTNDKPLLHESLQFGVCGLQLREHAIASCQLPLQTANCRLQTKL